MRYEEIYVKGGSQVNEDAIVLREDIKVFSVIDGATGMGNLSGKIAADLVKEGLETITMEEPLSHAIERANQRLGVEQANRLNAESIEAIAKENRSTCALAAVKVTDNRLEYVQAGDCMIFLRYQNDDIRFLTFDHLAALDQVAISLAHEIMREQIEPHDDPNHWEEAKIQQVLGEIIKEIKPGLIENRRKLNTLEGYGIIDGSSETMKFLDYGSVSLHQVKQILLLTDGLQLPANQTSAQETWLRTAEFGFTYGLEKLKNEVEQRESTDKACFRYPRLKVSDDKTGVLLNLY